jgi:hypothetical protein
LFLITIIYFILIFTQTNIILCLSFKKNKILWTKYHCLSGSHVGEARSTVIDYIALQQCKKCLCNKCACKLQSSLSDAIIGAQVEKLGHCLKGPLYMPVP